MSLENTPRIYVGTYAKYNAGSIAGAWLDLDDYAGAAEFYTACAALHNDEADPEYMFQDYEGFPRSFYSESGDINELYEYIDFCKSSDLSQAAIDAGLDLGISLDSIEEAYQGYYSSAMDFAQEMAESTGSLQDNLAWPYTCIDWEYAARELMYDYMEQDGHYFRNM
jgi:antirestriction protein